MVAMKWALASLLLISPIFANGQNARFSAEGVRRWRCRNAGSNRGGDFTVADEFGQPTSNRN
jgi:hypothetical protein